MSYSSFVSMIRGIKIDDWNKFYDSLWEFSANHDSDLIGEAAEYHNIDREEVDGDHLREYLSDSGKLIDSQYLDGQFLGFNLLTIEVYGDNKYFDLEAITGISKTIDEDAIGEFIKTYYKDYPVRDWLVEWTC